MSVYSFTALITGVVLGYLFNLRVLTYHSSVHTFPTPETEQINGVLNRVYSIFSVLPYGALVPLLISALLEPIAYGDSPLKALMLYAYEVTEHWTGFKDSQRRQIEAREAEVAKAVSTTVNAQASPRVVAGVPTEETLNVAIGQALESGPQVIKQPYFNGSMVLQASVGAGEPRRLEIPNSLEVLFSINEILWCCFAVAEVEWQLKSKGAGSVIAHGKYEAGDMRSSDFMWSVKAPAYIDAEELKPMRMIMGQSFWDDVCEAWRLMERDQFNLFESRYYHPDVVCMAHAIYTITSRSNATLQDGALVKHKVVDQVAPKEVSS